MSHFVEIKGESNSPKRVVLTGNSATVGSASSCEISIAHKEVPSHALTIDIRGNDFWIQNLNPYSIYVGVEEVTPNAWSPWTLGDTIQLTKSIALTLHEQVEEVATASTKSVASGEAKSMDIGKILQIIIIGICVIGAPMILFADKDDVTQEIDKEFDFNQIVTELQLRSDDIEYVSVRRYLQQAWMADRRFRNKNQAAVTKTYELLISHRLVRDNPDGNETLSQINDYAKRRLSALRYDE